MQTDIRIEKLISTGGIPLGNEEAIETVGDLLDELNHMLDAADAKDIIGAISFKAENGKYYAITVEAVINECAKEFAEQFGDGEEL